MERRKFIKLSAAASAIGLTPFELQAALKSVVAFAECPNISNRKLVLINLAGANDGLNTIIPINQYDTYSNLRPTIKVPDSGLNKYITLDTTLPENQQIGLNPALTSFKTIYDKSWLRIMQSVGYPSQNKSHFKSTDLYLTGNDGNSLSNGVDSGWIGRFMELHYPNLTVETFPLGVEIGSSKTSLGFHGEAEHGLALNITGQDPAGFYTVLSGLGGVPPTTIPNSDYGIELDYIINTDKLSNQYAQAISSAFNAGQNAVSYPDTDISSQLKTVARLISGDLQSKVFLVRLGGFDTHNAQIQETGNVLGKHYDLLTQMSQAIESFMNDLKSQNIADDVVGLTFSEFGRKAAENGSFGTDHGEIAPMFVFGEPVAGGVSGVNPNLSEATSGNNYQIQTVQYDYRQTFATLLQNFLGANNTVIDATFFNHSLNDSFSNLKIDALLKEQFVVPAECLGSLSTDKFLNELKRWLLFPNPFRDVITISGIDDVQSITYRIYNNTGRLLLSKNEKLINGKLVLNALPLNTGVYIFEITSGFNKEIHKVVKI